VLIKKGFLDGISQAQERTTEKGCRVYQGTDPEGQD
jgi:hypothetical protein